jgi:hypothetical protein
MTTVHHNVALLLCGALARETIALVERHRWQVELFGISALDHLYPERIAPDVERRLRELIPRFWRVIVLFGDCGTAGRLDTVLQRYNVPRISGPHCYEMYGGQATEQLLQEQPGTFFLTDFLVRSFNGAVRRGLGLDRFPELRELYFGNYTRIVYLMQREDADLQARAAAIASELHLPLELRSTGYGLLEQRLATLMETIHQEHYQPVLAEEPIYGHLSDLVLEKHSPAGAGARRRRAGQRATGEPLSRSRRSGGHGNGPDRL